MYKHKLLLLTTVVVVVIFATATAKISKSYLEEQKQQLALRDLSSPENLTELYYAIKFLENSQKKLKLPEKTCLLVNKWMNAINPNASYNNNYYKRYFMLSHINQKGHCIDLKIPILGNKNLSVLDENIYFCNKLAAAKLISYKCPSEESYTDSGFNIYRNLSYLSDLKKNDVSSDNSKKNIVFMDDSNTTIFLASIEKRSKKFSSVSIVQQALTLEAIDLWLSVNKMNSNGDNLKRMVASIQTIKEKIAHSGDIALLYYMDNILKNLATNYQIYAPTINLTFDNIKIDTSYNANVAFVVFIEQHLSNKNIISSTIQCNDSIDIAIAIESSSISLKSETDDGYSVYGSAVDFSPAKEVFNNGLNYAYCEMTITIDDDSKLLENSFKVNFIAELKTVDPELIKRHCTITVADDGPIKVVYPKKVTDTIQANNYETIEIVVESAVYGFLRLKSDDNSNHIVVMKPILTPEEPTHLKFKLVLDKMAGNEFAYESGLYAIEFVPAVKHLASSLDTIWTIGHINIEFVEGSVLKEKSLDRSKPQISAESIPVLAQGYKLISIVYIALIGAASMTIPIIWKSMGVRIDFTKVFLPYHILMVTWLCTMFCLYVYAWTVINMMQTLKAALAISIPAFLCCKRLFS